MLKYGILHGYPKDAVTRFVKYYNLAYVFSDPSQSRQSLTSSEQALLNGYVMGYSATRPRSRDERIASVNRFRDEHETELKTVIEKVFPDIAKEHVITLDEPEAQTFHHAPYVGSLALEGF